MSRTLSLLLTLALLTGCAVTGPSYQEKQAEAGPAPENLARLYFFRESRFMSAGSDASITLNNNKIGECGNGSYFYSDVAPGSYQLGADSWGTAGEFRVSKELEAGREYFFEVQVDEGYVMSGAMLGFIGQAIYASNNPNSGGWLLFEHKQEEAVEKLKGLPFSLDGD